MLQPPGLWDLLLWQLAQLCVWCLWFLCCGKGRCQQHMNSMDCNKVAVKPIWSVVSLPLETLGIRFYLQEKSYPNGCESKAFKMLRIHLTLEFFCSRFGVNCLPWTDWRPCQGLGCRLRQD